MDRVVLTVTQDEIKGQDLAKTRLKPALFVSFRFKDEASTHMRSEIENILRPNGSFDLLDGKDVGDGDWATVIRARMTKSKLILADVTGPSREIMFEIGFSANKRTMLCVRDEESLATLPKWVTGHNIYTYSGTDLPVLARRVWESLTTQRARVTNNRLKPVPGTAIWLQSHDSDWAEPHFARCSAMASEHGVRVQRVFPEDLRSFEDAREYLGTQWVMGCLDGAMQDYAAHFYFGDVAGRQWAGQGKTYKRRAFVVSRNPAQATGWLADSVGRLPASDIWIPSPSGDLWDSMRTDFRSFQAIGSGRNG